MTGGDRSLQRIGTRLATEGSGSVERGQTPADEDVIPASPVLIEQKDRLAGRAR